MLKLKNFYHTCKFSTLIINFWEVWPREILDLSRQLNLMIRLEKVLKTSLLDVLRMSWRCLEDVYKTSWRLLKMFLQDVLKTFWGRLKDILARLLEDVLKTSWRHLGKMYVSAIRLEDVLKTSWKCLENVFWRHMSKVNIFDLITTSWRCLLKTKIKDFFKTSYAFIKTNVCWD